MASLLVDGGRGRKPTSLTLRISDTGVGIPLENLPILFDRLY